MTELAIHARNLCKAYRTGSVSTPVLRGLDLDVRAGECVFLVGPSGSGKTTLLSILGCVLSADAGELRVLGQNVSGWRPRKQARFRRERIGFVFQRFHLFDGLRAWENVRVAFDLLGHSPRHGRTESLQLLERVGLADRAFHRIGQLSMGQRQRVALARALAGNPDLIFADEPTASLDADTGRQAMELLKKLCAELGKSVVVVTHDNRIYPLADRILTLVDGRIADDAGQALPANSDDAAWDPLTGPPAELPGRPHLTPSVASVVSCPAQAQLRPDPLNRTEQRQQRLEAVPAGGAR